MDCYEKYIKYKSKYLNLKSIMDGGRNENDDLKYYHVGAEKYKLSLVEYFNIIKSTSAIFIGDMMMVITKPGEVYLIDDYEKNEQFKLIYDIKKESNFSAASTEEGLLGIANIYDKIYLCYTARLKLSGTTLVISEYNYINGILVKNRDIFSQYFKDLIHHGGHIIATTDGKLLLGTGDGGPQGDPSNVGQNMQSYLAKLLEIDPNNGNIKIIAMGLRNPWKFSIDKQKRIWIGDVGWDTVESVKLVDQQDRLYNFGWSIYEGSVHMKGKPNIGLDKFDQPIWEYHTSNKLGRCIIGGYFIDSLKIYLFADYLGIIRAIQYNGKYWEEIANDKFDIKINSLAYDGKNLYVLGDKMIYLLQIKNVINQ